MQMNLIIDFAKPVAVLSIICAAAGTLLAVTHQMTQPVIEANAAAAANAMRSELLPQADSFTAYTKESVKNVTDIFIADNGAGAVITAQAAGYGGNVPVMVAFDAQGSIQAVRFLPNTETPGLGQKVQTPAFANQFAGKPASELALGTDIIAITGATISSRAALTAVNSAIEAYTVAVSGKQAQTELTEQEILQTVLPRAGKLTKRDTTLPNVTALYTGEVYGTIIAVEGVGYHKKPMHAIVGFDDDGIITGIWTNGMNEGEPIREAMTGLSFGENAVGHSDISAIDGIAGATGSSDLMKKTIQMALDAYQAWKGA